MSQKPYDAAYFDRWYRGPDAPRGEVELRRDVALAVAAAESVLARELTGVLDVGAGEGRWQPVLQQLRPAASYLGVEPSEYAVERFGATRNLCHGTFATLDVLAFDDPFDLVICADVLHYLSEAEIDAGLDTFVDLVGGVAYIEISTADDQGEGDRMDFQARSAVWYRERLHRAGLIPVGLQLYVHREVAADLEALDLVDHRLL